MLMKLWNDEVGFLVSAELVLVATILVIGMIVGLSEIQHAVVQELGDVGDAIGSVNQAYSYTGFSAEKNTNSKTETKSFTRGSSSADNKDDCDNNECALDCDNVVAEGNKN